MTYTLFAESVQGATHKRKGIACQDSYKLLQYGESFIVSVADGHGGDDYIFSKSGSHIAVNVFCDTMRKYYDEYKEYPETLITFLTTRGEEVARQVTQEWRRRVLLNFKRKSRNYTIQFTRDESSVDPTYKNIFTEGSSKEEDVYKKYGTTLLGLFILDDYVFGFQIGDGDIVSVNTSNVHSLLPISKQLGVDTYSLCMTNAWRKAVTSIAKVSRVANEESVFFITTDGFANSYPNDLELSKTYAAYLNFLQEHGPNTMKKNLKSWLQETTLDGSGDDITFACAIKATK